MAGDIILTRNDNLVGKMIRFLTTHRGESRSEVNHTGVMVNPTAIVEALKKVERRAAVLAYGPPSKQKISVYRPLNISEADIRTITAKAESYVGKGYGYLKIVAHLFDWTLNGAYVFRRLAGMDNYPICSWLVAHAYSAAGKDFGVAPGAASPDDIWDFVDKNPDKYECVWPLDRWT